MSACVILATALAGNYREVWYEKRGNTIDGVERSSPPPITIVETGEFFSYRSGAWTYWAVGQRVTEALDDRAFHRALSRRP